MDTTDTEQNREPWGRYDIRVPRSLWRAAATRARREGTPLAGLIRAWLEEYAAGER